MTHLFIPTRTRDAEHPAADRVVESRAVQTEMARLPTGNLSTICFLTFLITFAVAVQQSTTRSFIAEWEFQKRPWQAMNVTRSKLLRHRLDAGYWSEPSSGLSSSGDWWLFGGKGFEKQYSDLWKFHGRTLQWERIYPKSDPIVRAMVSPEKIPQPVLCGHDTPGRTVLAVYGPKLHTDTVWIYEVNDTLWTSYVCLCCDKQNSKHSFCPNFKQAPVAWCDTTNGALLAVIPNSSALQLWRFSLLTTRWEHVQLTTPSIKNNNYNYKCNFTNESSLLYTSADGLLYILCAENSTTLKRYVYRYPNANGELESLGTINLNILPQKITLTATRSLNGKIYLILAYQQLIDIWLLDENSLSWIPIINIWKGNALKWVQAMSSSSGIYYLNIDNNYIMLSNPKLNEQKLEGVYQEQGIFIINIIQDDGTILRGDNVMKRNDSITIATTMSTEIITEKITNSEIKNHSTSSSTTTTTTTTTPSSTTTTTTEWSAELIMEGSPENISTCCWNLTENIVGNDRALLAISPVVNEVTRPLQANTQDNEISYGAIIFFVLSLSLFVFGGVVILIKRWIFKWSDENNSGTMLKEPPPIRYSVIPDELSYRSFPTA